MSTPPPCRPRPAPRCPKQPSMPLNAGRVLGSAVLAAGCPNSRSNTITWRPAAMPRPCCACAKPRRLEGVGAGRRVCSADCRARQTGKGPGIRVMPGQSRKIARDQIQCWSARTARHGRPSTHDAAYMPGQRRLDRETRMHAMQAAAGWGQQGAEKQLQDGSRQPGCPRIRRASRGISTKSRSRVQLKAARTASPGRLALTSTL